MPNFSRRSLLCAFGIVSVRPLVSFPIMAQAKAAIAKPGENRFAYANAEQAKRSPCKLTSEDTAGALSVFELNVLSRSGPSRHLHHREDEWCYILAGEFAFEVGNDKLTLSAGGSIWMPRNVPHVWANTASSNGKLVVACQPGGFEKFFDELGEIPEDQVNPETVSRVMARYGMEYLGPPLFGLWRKPAVQR